MKSFSRFSVVVIWTILAIAPMSAHAKLLGQPDKRAAAAAEKTDRAVSQIQRALDEQRLLDAGRLLDEALLAGMADPRLALLDGQLDLSRGRLADAQQKFAAVEKTPAVRPAALEGEGISLSLLGRSSEALAVLQKAVEADPKAWRSWNALGSEFDRRSQWSDADAAYDRAVTLSDGAAIALNNRGYSKLLQHRQAEAVDDLVKALRKRPDFSEARTNLRLALAMGGDYERAIAGGAAGDQATYLNNAGFAAAMRGDYANAESLLERALKLKSQYYDRASENLKVVQALASQAKKPSNATP